MDKVYAVSFLILAVGVLVVCFSFAFTHLRKSAISAGVCVQASPADGEGLVFNLNFYEDELDEDKEAKVDEAFHFLDRRREYLHNQMLGIRARSKEEMEARAAAGEPLKLRASQGEFNGA